MGDHRRKGIKHYLPEEGLNKLMAEADDEEIVPIKKALNCVGRSEPTGDRWGDHWNEGLYRS